MRVCLASLLVVGFAATQADAADRKGQLFASWEAARRGVKSLIVEFTLETWDPIFRERQNGTGAAGFEEESI
jgi:hypothetical protein